MWSTLASDGAPYACSANGSGVSLSALVERGHELRPDRAVAGAAHEPGAAKHQQDVDKRQQ